ncbi:MAG: LuxR C-terminal-related transcriptional regulator [Alphaproteobacteria bacterium]
MALGRRAFEERRWADAYRALTSASGAGGLVGADLERLAVAAYLVGEDDAYLQALEQAHQAHFAAGQLTAAIRSVFWLGLRLMLRGEGGRANGWLARARRLLDGAPDDCAEHGYLMLPLAEQCLARGEVEAAYVTAADAAAIGERCRDDDLTACARHVQGRACFVQKRVGEGLALLDEAMVMVASGTLSPIMTGLIYCSVIEAYQEIWAIDRAAEWTAALSTWCEAQPQMVAFAGVCQVHRAEILLLQGDWSRALDEAKRAHQRCRQVNRPAAAAALYQQAEAHRLRGELTAAEHAYQGASQLGFDPQPGLALLRLAQGRHETAVGAMQRSLDSARERPQRLRLLPAYVEIMLAAGDLDAAAEACREFKDGVDALEGGALRATAAFADGAILLSKGEASTALERLRLAFETWQRLDVPYAAARARLLMGQACRDMGDADGCRLELDAARAVFDQLGAAPDVVRVDALLSHSRSNTRHGLTPRELQVLHLVASGETNKAIAAVLHLSERTVDRHVSNIFTKLDVTTRTAAAAYAYRHNLA